MNFIRLWWVTLTLRLPATFAKSTGSFLLKVSVKCRLKCNFIGMVIGVLIYIE